MTNYEYRHAIEVSASAETAWRVYCDPASWPQWDASVEHMSLDGEFAEGTSGKLKLKGQDALPFKITAVERGRSFIDETAIPGGVIRFGHTIDALGGGAIRLTHSVKIDAPKDLATQIGPFVTADIPDAMASLARYIEANEAEL